jgi:hypothetical protein
VFAGRNQLLSQQIAVAVGRLDRPPPRPELCGPRQQLSGLTTVCPNLKLAEGSFLLIDGYRRMGTLVRVDSDQHRHDTPP